MVKGNRFGGFGRMGEAGTNQAGIDAMKNETDRRIALAKKFAVNEEVLIDGGKRLGVIKDIDMKTGNLMIKTRTGVIEPRSPDFVEKIEKKVKDKDVE